MIAMRWRAASVLSLAAAGAVAGCDTLLTEPAPGAAEVRVSFAVEGVDAGGTAAAFEKADRVFLRFTRPDSVQRDTVVRIAPREGVARARLVLDTKERVKALGVYAQLRRGQAPLFEGARVIRVEVGEPTSAEIALTPVPFALRADRDQVTFQQPGDTVHLASALLYATGDVLAARAGTWASTAPDVVFVTQSGIAAARKKGQALLVVSHGTLADTVAARVEGGR